MRLSTRILWQVTIGFGIIAALIGLSLRYFFVQPLPFNFQFVLHAHSHLMLLAWLFNALLLLIYKQWNIEMPTLDRWLFLVLCFCALGMLASFPFQGYAVVSIAFSTLHLWVSYVLLIKVWKLAKDKGLPGRLVRLGVVFFFLSSLGPYALGPMMANDLQSSPWYRQAIFFYLHFLYNGAFMFFMLAFIAKKWVKTSLLRESRIVWLLAIGVILTWFQNLDYSFDSTWINLFGGLGALSQLLGGWMLIRSIRISYLKGFQLIILITLAGKLVFQLFGAVPIIADAVVNNHFYLIAWLHFVFLGIFTPFIWHQLSEHIRGYKRLMAIYWILFVASEGALIIPSAFPVEGFMYCPHITL